MSIRLLTSLLGTSKTIAPVIFAPAFSDWASREFLIDFRDRAGTVAPVAVSRIVSLAGSKLTAVVLLVLETVSATTTNTSFTLGLSAPDAVNCGAALGTTESVATAPAWPSASGATVGIGF